jgi:hypothetical protein
MSTFILAGIDPGGATGLAVAKVHLMDKVIYPNKLALTSVGTPSEALAYVTGYNALFVVVEQRASSPSSSEGLKPYETILDGLHDIGFEVGKPPRRFNFVPGCVLLINPGIWKPFMKKHPQIGYSHWKPQSQHEKDALDLLHYSLMINYPKRTVHYA